MEKNDPVTCQTRTIFSNNENEARVFPSYLGPGSDRGLVVIREQVILPQVLIWREYQSLYGKYYYLVTNNRISLSPHGQEIADTGFHENASAVIGDECAGIACLGRVVTRRCSYLVISAKAMIFAPY